MNKLAFSLFLSFFLFARAQRIRDFDSVTCRADSLVMAKTHKFEKPDRIRCVDARLLSSLHVEHEPHWFEWVICNIGWWTPESVECKRPKEDRDAIEPELWTCTPRGASVESIKMKCHSETHDPCGTSIDSTCVVVYDPSAEFITLISILYLFLFVICIVSFGAIMHFTQCLFVYKGPVPSLAERKLGAKRLAARE